MNEPACGSGSCPRSEHLGVVRGPVTLADRSIVRGGLYAGTARSHRRVWLALGLMIVAGNALAAPKACEDLKAEIEAKIQAQGVTSYTLEIISAEEAKSQDPAMIVGSCNFGRMKIIYQKNDR